jgi:hypothetical protein
MFMVDIMLLPMIMMPATASLIDENQHCINNRQTGVFQRAWETPAYFQKPGAVYTLEIPPEGPE